MTTLSLNALKAFEIDQVAANNVIGGWSGYSSSNSNSNSGHYGHSSGGSISSHYQSVSISTSNSGHYSKTKETYFSGGCNCVCGPVQW